jgi:hypothetical protein
MLKIKKINRWLFNTILEDNKTKSGDAESIAASTIHTASNTPSARAVATSLMRHQRNQCHNPMKIAHKP